MTFSKGGDMCVKRWCLLQAGMVAALALAGCGGGGGGSGDAEDGAAPPAAATTALKKVDVSKLPVADNELPPQDDGRVEPVGPTGWMALPKDKRYIARFAEKDRSSLPRIEILSAATPFPEFGDVTAANVGEFCGRMQKELTGSKKKLIESCKPLQIGDHVWARSVRVVRTSGGMAQVQSLQSIINNRLYTVDLIVEGQEAEDLKKVKDYGYAVAAKTKFADNKPFNPAPPMTEPMPPAEPAP